MVASLKPAKLIAVIGPTASGKSQIALQLAQQYNGEIICADSRTVYNGMDIGTAKPSAEDQKLIKHHLLDVVEPDQPFTVADFQKLANQAIDDIHNRGNLAIMVGGTGLYVDSILYDFSFRPANPKERQRLEKLSVNELQQEISSRGLELPENSQNPRHLVRLLETNGGVGARQPLRANTLVLGVELPNDELRQRISDRIDQMVEAGLIDEVKKLVEAYGWQAEAMKAIGYREWQDYLAGPQSSEDLIKTKELILKNSWAYARRQRTWFRRNKDIIWQDTIEHVSVTIEG